jgi:hypothetical protein
MNAIVVYNLLLGTAIIGANVFLTFRIFSIASRIIKNTTEINNTTKIIAYTTTLNGINVQQVLENIERIDPSEKGKSRIYSQFLENKLGKSSNTTLGMDSTLNILKKEIANDKKNAEKIKVALISLAFVYILALVIALFASGFSPLSLMLLIGTTLITLIVYLRLNK